MNVTASVETCGSQVYQGDSSLYHRMWGLPPRAQITSYNLMVYWITFIKRLWPKNVMTISVTILYFKHVEKFWRDGDLI